MRINKYLASAGIGSRRKVEEYILRGLVQVNGVIVTELGTDIKESDKVECKGKLVELDDSKVYYLLNKPKGYITSTSDEQGRPTVLKLLKNVNARVYPVGRLDYNTEGMLILTNDGDFTYEVTHPSSHTTKTYEVVTKYPLRDEQIELFKRGILIDDYMTKPAIVEVMGEKDGKHITNITICEGRNRQIRKCFEIIKLQILRLRRVKIGSLELEDLPLGEYRKLNHGDIEKILRHKI